MKLKTTLALIFGATAAMAGCSSTSNLSDDKRVHCAPRDYEFPYKKGCRPAPARVAECSSPAPRAESPKVHCMPRDYNFPYKPGCGPQ